MAAATFAVYFAAFFVGGVVMWFRWHTPLSLRREIALSEMIIGSGFSGWFLLTVKSASPQANRIRMNTLITAVLALQIVVSVLQ